MLDPSKKHSWRKINKLDPDDLLVLAEAAPVLEAWRLPTAGKLRFHLAVRLAIDLVPVRECTEPHDRSA